MNVHHPIYGRFFKTIQTLIVMPFKLTLVVTIFFLCNLFSSKDFLTINFPTIMSRRFFSEHWDSFCCSQGKNKRIYESNNSKKSNNNTTIIIYQGYHLLSDCSYPKFCRLSILVLPSLLFSTQAFSYDLIFLFLFLTLDSLDQRSISRSIFWVSIVFA